MGSWGKSKWFPFIEGGTYSIMGAVLAEEDCHVPCTECQRATARTQRSDCSWMWLTSIKPIAPDLVEELANKHLGKGLRGFRGVRSKSPSPKSSTGQLI